MRAEALGTGRAGAGAPGWVLAILRAPGVALAGRVLLTSAYWTSGLQKLFAFDAAIAEAAALGLPAPALTAALTIRSNWRGRPR